MVLMVHEILTGKSPGKENSKSEPDTNVTIKLKGIIKMVEWLK